MLLNSPDEINTKEIVKEKTKSIENYLKIIEKYLFIFYGQGRKLDSRSKKNQNMIICF